MFKIISSLDKKKIILFGLIVHIIAAWFNLGVHQADELFQIYEFAGYKLGLNTAADLPWEFGEQMRSGIEPFLVYVFTKGCYFISISNPFVISFFLRLVQSLLSFWATVLLINYFEKEITNEKIKKYLWIFGLLFWCLPYFHARLSAENVSATLFLFGFILCANTKDGRYLLLKSLIGGIFLGLAFQCRFQISFMIAGFLAWQFFIAKIEKKFLLFCLSGLIISVGIGLLIDKWFYLQWVFSWWNYLDVNFFQDKASHFGKEPFYFYFSESIIQLIPPFSVIIISFILLFWIKFKKHLLTWITLPFIFLHFCIPHKELRFLFPVLNFLPLIVLLYYQSFEDKKDGIINAIRSRAFIYCFVIVNFGALIVFALRPANNLLKMLNEIYSLAEGKKTILVYNNDDPYGKMGALNYFKNKNITSHKLNEININETTDRLFYFSETFNVDDSLVISGQRFNKIYSNFPNWFSYLNFNGWIERATFSIYKSEKTKSN